MKKTVVYFMPGLAASSSIFQGINLPENEFETILLEWVLPLKKETLVDYAKRMAKNIKHENAVLIGVSFGGVLVQEMAAFLNLKKVIIISSIKANTELPRRMKIAKTTKAYKMIPTHLMQDVEKLVKYAFGESLKRKLKLYEKFLLMRDKIYLDWAIEQMICWERTIIDEKVIHIHGDADEVFPIKHIKNAIIVRGGTHALILSKHRWLNANLPKIIQDAN